MGNRRIAVSIVTPSSSDFNSAARATAGASTLSTARSGTTAAPSYLSASMSFGAKLVRSTILPDARATFRSTRPNARPLEYDSMMAIPAIWCPIPRWAWPATMTSTRPAGIAPATLKISPFTWQDPRSVGRSKRSHVPPACAATTTIDAPAARSVLASATMTGARGAIVRPRTFAAIVELSAAAVTTPMIPIRTPAVSTMVEGLTLGQSTGRPVDSSMMFAARNGKRASAARAFNAPRGSSPRPAGIAAAPIGP